MVDDNYAQVFAGKERAALMLTDALAAAPGALDAAQRALLREHFDDAELVELALGVGLFLGMSKVLITLGLEPALPMPVTVVPTPGSG